MPREHKTRSERLLLKPLLFAITAFGLACGQQHATGEDTDGFKPAVATVQHLLEPVPEFATSRSGTETVVIADVAERTVLSVVNVWATKNVSESVPGLDAFRDDPLFRDFFGPRFFEQIPRDRQQRSLGSGVIVSDNGIILTNSHVIEKADELRVTLPDGRDVVAKVVGSDSKSDIAVLRIEGDTGPLTALPIGDSSRMRLGDVVIAIGNPFGVGQTVTMGIVSALGRGHVGIVDYEDFIQTDAAINPGNSGGALVNMRGELIGLNTAIVSRTGGNQGVGFAIPSNLAEPTMRALLEDGKITRGWLGVAIQDLSKELAQGLGVNVEQGVLVSDVTSGSPAEKAGLRRGDVIVDLDGKSVISSSRLRNRIALAGPKTTVRLGVIRNNKRQVISVTLGELAEQEEVLVPTEDAAKSDVLGIEVAQLDSATRRRFSISKDVEQGVVITKVDPNGRAARVSLRPGDVIVEVNREKVKGPADFRKRVAEGANKTVLLLVQREGSTIFVAISK